MHSLPGGIELLNLKSAFSNLKSPGSICPDTSLGAAYSFKLL